MKKSVKKYDTAKALADKLIEMLEKGVSPWHKSWNCGGCGLPRSVNERVYRGMNIFILGMMGYDNPYWTTFKKCRELGGTVRKGEKGCPVMYWQSKDIPAVDEDGYPVLDDNGKQKVKRIMVIRGYTVFNASQCDGLPDKYYPKPVKANTKRHKDCKAAKAVWDGYKDKPKLVHGSSGCCYVPLVDEIRMPDMERFDSVGEYYASLFHEACHSTGHEKRLNRKMTGAFGSEQYGKEELIAEMGAQILCQQCGITRTLENTAAYCKSWAKAIKSMPNYGKAIVCAAAQAQKASDYITGVKYGKED